MASNLIESKVEHLGISYPLELRKVPRRRCYTWVLGHENGSPMKRGSRPVSDVETAQLQALRYLERVWPHGRLNPHGPGNGQV